MTTIELNVKNGLQDAIAKALNATSVEVLVSMPKSLIPLKCDWFVSENQIKGIADVVAIVDGKKMMFKYI